MSDTILEIEGLRKVYAGGVKALDGLDLEIRKGDLRAGYGRLQASCWA